MWQVSLTLVTAGITVCFFSGRIKKTVLLLDLRGYNPVGKVEATICPVPLPLRESHSMKHEVRNL